MSAHTVAFATHILSLALTACAIVYADHTGLSWIQKKIQTVPHKTLHYLHWAVGIGLGLMIGSGIVLFWPVKDYLLSSFPFYIKMTFVLALIINSIVIENLMHVATHTPFQDVPKKVRNKLFVSGAVSGISWLGAAVAAFFLF